MELISNNKDILLLILSNIEHPKNTKHPILFVSKQLRKHCIHIIKSKIYWELQFALINKTINFTNNLNINLHNLFFSINKKKFNLNKTIKRNTDCFRFCIENFNCSKLIIHSLEYSLFNNIYLLETILECYPKLKQSYDFYGYCIKKDAVMGLCFTIEQLDIQIPNDFFTYVFNNQYMKNWVIIIENLVLSGRVDHLLNDNVLTLLNNSYEVTKYLLNFGLNPMFNNGDIVRFIYKSDILQLYIDDGRLDVTSQNSRILESMHNDFDAVKKLIKMGCDPTKTDLLLYYIEDSSNMLNHITYLLDDERYTFDIVYLSLCRSLFLSPRISSEHINAILNHPKMNMDNKIDEKIKLLKTNYCKVFLENKNFCNPKNKLELEEYLKNYDFNECRYIFTHGHSSYFSKCSIRKYVKISSTINLIMGSYYLVKSCYYGFGDNKFSGVMGILGVLSWVINYKRFG